MARYPNFVSGAYQAQALTAAADECINLYLEQVPQSNVGTKNDRFLTRSPGRHVLCTIPDGPCRGITAGDGRLFIAGYSTLYELDATNLAAPVSIGRYAPGVTPVLMFQNGNQLFVGASGLGYLQNGLSLTQVVTCAYPGYLDTYFIAQQPNSNQFNISAPLDGTSWDPLDFASKEGAADRLVATFADHEELWLIGARTTEVWYDSGAATFPFQRIQGAFVEQGAVAPYSVVKLDNSLFFLGGDDRGVGIVWRMNGYLPVRVSTHAVEVQWQEYSDISDAIAYAYQEGGHSFYVLNFPTGNATWVYDCATNLWHRRGFWDANAGQYDADVAWYHAYLKGSGFASGVGLHVVGDHRTNSNGSANIYQQSIDFYDENGGPLRWQRTAPHLATELQWNYYQKLRLDMQVGGSTYPHPDAWREAGNNPTIGMQISRDGGFDFDSELDGSMGMVGQYKAWVEWRQLGRARDAVFRVFGSDPIQIAIVDAYLDLVPE